MDSWRSAIAVGLVLGACFGIGVIVGTERTTREADRVAARAALALDSATHVHRDTLRALRRQATRIDTVVVRQAARVRRLVDTVRLVLTDTVPVPADLTRALAEQADSLRLACTALATTCADERRWSDSLRVIERAALDSMRVVLATRPVSTSRARARWQAARNTVAWVGVGALLGVVAR